MNWEAVANDHYYHTRKVEAEARSSRNPDKWMEYAELKFSKGSYILGISGCMNAAGLWEGAGKTDAALSACERGLDIAMSFGFMDLAVILSGCAAQVHEHVKNWNGAIAAYEKLGAFCEEKKAWFQAADAYEHAAEMMAMAGQDTGPYTKPVDLWEINAQYWEKEGHDDDALWSRNHVTLYKKLSV